MILPQPDASGGTGSVPLPLRTELTRGLFGLAEGYLSSRWGVGGMTDGRATLNAQGNVRPAAAEAEDVKPSDRVAELLKNPIVIGIALAAVVALVISLARR